MFWEKYVEDNFDQSDTNRILSGAHWETWVFQSGPSPVEYDFSTASSNKSLALADDYISLAGDSSPANFKDYEQFDYQLKTLFLQRLKSREGEVTKAILQRVDLDLNVSYE